MIDRTAIHIVELLCEKGVFDDIAVGSDRVMPIATVIAGFFISKCVELKGIKFAMLFLFLT
jgi:hypothetical protein